MQGTLELDSLIEELATRIIEQYVQTPSSNPSGNVCSEGDPCSRQDPPRC